MEDTFDINDAIIYTIKATATVHLGMRYGGSSALTKILPEQITEDQNGNIQIIDIQEYEKDKETQ